jgi:hypothetical protein
MRSRFPSAFTWALCRRLAAGAVLLALLPVAASAQRGGRVARGARGAGGGGLVGDPSPTLTADDVARIDPVAMLMSRAAQAGVADSQVAALRTIGRALASRNAPHLRTLDSLLRAVRAHAADSAASENVRLMRLGDDRMAFTAVLGRIRDNDDAAATEAMRLFAGRQLRWAYDVVREQRAIMGAVVRGGSVPAALPSPVDGTHGP